MEGMLLWRIEKMRVTPEHISAHLSKHLIHFLCLNTGDYLLKYFQYGQNG